MKEKAKAPFGPLSGGEAQRVLIARAIVDEPQVLLLDEPTASVDPQAEQLIDNQLLELNKTMTILMVTHDLKRSSIRWANCCACTARHFLKS